MTTKELLKFLVSKKSETPDDGGLLDFIENYLSNFKAIRIDCEDVKNLFIYRRFSEGDHLCFAGHVDVVPAGNGWNYSPYIAHEEDGYIYGRGTQDMKGGLSAFIQAVKDTDNFKGTLSLLLTSDEEGDATNGTIKVLEYLKEKDMLPNAVVVAEPTCETKFGDTIKVGRRGSINGFITLKGKQGHAAYPQKALNPIDKISYILNDLSGYHFDKGDEFFSPSQLVITDLRAGMEVTNVTPGELKMMFNVRNTPKTTQKEIREFITNKFKNLDFTLKLTQGSYPFLTNSNSKLVLNIEQSIKSVVGKDTKHSTSGGTSDARFIAQFGVDVVEFGVINDRIHAIDERTSVDEVNSLYEVFKNLIDNWEQP